MYISFTLFVEFTMVFYLINSQELFEMAATDFITGK